RKSGRRTANSAVGGARDGGDDAGGDDPWAGRAADRRGAPAGARAGQVLIRIRAGGGCPSDGRSYTGERKSSQDPRGVGHAWRGDVVALGAGADGFAVGDRVAPDWRVICGRCYYCRRGIFNYCQNLAGGQVRGGFAEYGVAPTTNLRPIPD